MRPKLVKIDHCGSSSTLSINSRGGNAGAQLFINIGHVLSVWLSLSFELHFDGEMAFEILSASLEMHSSFSSLFQMQDVLHNMGR